MITKRGKIYLAKLGPTVGSEISKIRPVLVVSNDLNNRFSETITILPITSNVNKIYPFEVFIKAGEGNLPKDSKIKINQIRAIDLSRLIKEIGTIPQMRMKAIEKALIYHLALK